MAERPGHPGSRARTVLGRTGAGPSIGPDVTRDITLRHCGVRHDAYPTDEVPVDGSCARCGQNIPAWLTFTLGRGGRIYCSEYCQRLEEESQDIPEPVRRAAEDNVRAGDDGGSGQNAERTLDGDDPGGVRKRLRFLSRLR